MTSQIISRRVFISGRVQGVGFRASLNAQLRSNYPAITGFVRNLSDGRVEALFQGSPNDVEAMVDWCRQGPPRASVTNLTVEVELFDPKVSAFLKK